MTTVAGRGGFRQSALGLGLSCHPVPGLAVTGLMAGLVALAGVGVGRGSLAVLAMFATQLSIGWSNDAWDSARDAAVGRADKPVALGRVSVAVVWKAAAVAVVCALLFAGVLGLGEFLLITVGVVCGWSYNLRLKSTVVSWLPYAIAFGLLPAIATHALAAPRWPAAWAPVAGAMFGVAAHFTNVLPDVLDDEAFGIRGLPHRLGARASAVIGPTVLAGASAVILFGAGGHGLTLRLLGFVVALAASGWAAYAGARTPGSRRYFLAVIGVVILDVAFFAAAGSSLT